MGVVRKRSDLQFRRRTGKEMPVFEHFPQRKNDDHNEERVVARPPPRRQHKDIMEEDAKKRRQMALLMRARRECRMEMMSAKAETPGEKPDWGRKVEESKHQRYTICYLGNIPLINHYS